MKRTVRSNPLSTKNAAELPKYSKSLHFRGITSQVTVSERSEQTTNTTPEIVRSLRVWPSLFGWDTGFEWKLLGLLVGFGTRGAV